MRSGDDSAYATLGLPPGVGRAEVEEAYRRLIKRHHPDRTGGDCSRAAEINRAYTLLRRGFPDRERLRRVPVPVPPPARPRRRRRRAAWLVAGVVVTAAAIANYAPGRVSGGPAEAVAFRWAAPDRGPTEARLVSPLTSFEAPLQTTVIDRSIADALSFHSGGDSAATAEFSRACHSNLHNEPSVARFDSCAAFDEAMVILSGHPFTGPGPFDASSVTARQMGAARLLSDDVLAADSRLHQIRSRVELALVPNLDEAAAHKP